jgi:DNA-binding CsgD family transcriptional regulator
MPALPDLVEALVRAGRDAEAREWCSELAARIADDPIPGLHHALARGRAALADDADIDDAFADALLERAPDGSALELGRTELFYGSRLRQLERLADAQPHLEAAYRRFVEVGANGWADQARSELLAIGAPPRAATPRVLGALSPQEEQVAAIAATGASTREIAAALFLSPKTIETHLTRIYKKVGVRSKAELAHRLATHTATDVGP